MFRQIEATTGTQEHYFDLDRGVHWVEDEDTSVMHVDSLQCRSCNEYVEIEDDRYDDLEEKLELVVNG